MGLLDKKERILDVVLTDRGRELLSKNKLEFSYYAFSDEGVDYSGSINLSNSLGTNVELSTSLEDILFRDFAFEADQRKADGKKRSLESFLYTVPITAKTLPEFQVSVDTAVTSSLERYYMVDNLQLNKALTLNKEGEAIIIKATVQQLSPQLQVESYVDQQLANKALADLQAGKSILGKTLGNNSVALKDGKSLNTTSGKIQNVFEVLNNSLSGEQGIPTDQIENNVEIVLSRDSKDVVMKLKSSDGETVPSAGFLIEVFDSGSDGKLTKLFRDEEISDVGDDTLRESFESFIEVLLDDE